MSKQILYLRLFSLIFLSLMLQACGKAWLEANPDEDMVVPKTIKDYQLLLNNVSLFNTTQACGLGEIGAGDFYVTDAGWGLIYNIQEKSAYIWAPTAVFYGGELSLDWKFAYARVLNANVILHGIEKIQPLDSEQLEWGNVKGSALFFRAFEFFNMAQEYCLAYNPVSAHQDLGLPLRLDYDVNVKTKRSTLKQTYERIITDLELAAQLLATKPTFKTHPSREAVYALLARTYLVMENYERAGYYADLALQVQSDLVDYSKLNSNAAYPMTRFNAEVIFHSTFSYGIFGATSLTVVPELLAMYEVDDCRRTIFFKASANGMTFKGSYNADKNLFGGMTTGEMYLIRSESEARIGNLAEALGDLNTLRSKRWRGTYSELRSTDREVVLEYVLKERRQELVYRGLRWTDLRRLNKDARFAVTLSRTINGTKYTLLPNDKKYVLPIDEQEIRLGEIQQNDR